MNCSVTWMRGRVVLTVQQGDRRLALQLCPMAALRVGQLLQTGARQAIALAEADTKLGQRIAREALERARGDRGGGA